MTSRNALKQEMFDRLRSLVLGEDFSDGELHHMVSLNEDDNSAGREIAEELTQIALRHIAAARAEALEEAARIAREGCLVPPDGGSPTQEAVDLCDDIERRIRALMEPPA